MFSVSRHNESDSQAITYKNQQQMLIGSVELVKINHIIDQLKIQKDTLEQTCLSSNVTLLDKQKRAIITAIFSCIQQNISHIQNKLNAKKNDEKIDVLKAKYELIELCLLNISQILAEDFSRENLIKNLKILNTHRSTWRNFSLYPAHYGMVGAAVILVGSASLLGTIGIGLASHVGLRISESIVGINIRTTSLKLINDLFKELLNLDKLFSEKLQKIDPTLPKIIVDEICKNMGIDNSYELKNPLML